MKTLDAAIDTCVLVNLCAAGDLRRLLPDLGIELHVPSAVAGEAERLQVGGDGPDVEPQDVELQAFFDAGVLTECALQDGAETVLYVDLAGEVHDGEAMALAVAKARGWLLASDDRKARRRAAELGVKVITTPEIMARWAVMGGVDKDGIGRLLRNIQNIARFRPSGSFPCHDWWVKHAKE